MLDIRTILVNHTIYHKQGSASFFYFQHRRINCLNNVIANILFIELQKRINEHVHEKIKNFGFRLDPAHSQKQARGLDLRVFVEEEFY